MSAEAADAVLQAFASADLDAIERLCADDVIVFGTDEDEVWTDRPSLAVAIDGMRDLGLRARWVAEPLVRDDWVAGQVEFTLADGTAVPSRVSMVFASGRLAHAHYSVAVTTSASEPSSEPRSRSR